MPVEWLSFSQLIPAGSWAAKSIYDRVVGKSPRLNFDTDSGGIELHVFNTRDETIIIESIEASPSLLGFSAGQETIDIVRAIVAQRGHGVEQPIAVLSPGEKRLKLVSPCSGNVGKRMKRMRSDGLNSSTNLRDATSP
jgi:hypothetical protein